MTVNPKLERTLNQWASIFKKVVAPPALAPILERMRDRHDCEYPHEAFPKLDWDCFNDMLVGADCPEDMLDKLESHMGSGLGMSA